MFQETHPKCKYENIENKVGEKMHQKKKKRLPYGNWHNSILKPKPKNIIIGKEGHFIMIKVLIHQEDMMVFCFQTSHELNCMKI